MKYYRFKDYTEEELLEMINNEYGPDSEYMEDYKEHFKKEIEEYNKTITKEYTIEELKKLLEYKLKIKGEDK